jgi:hypothetical protein
MSSDSESACLPLKHSLRGKNSGCNYAAADLAPKNESRPYVDGHLGFEQAGALDPTRYAALSSRVGQPLGITQVEI